MYFSSAKRIKTPIAAVTGTAINIPDNPKIDPNAKRANITHSGCNETDPPTIFGNQISLYKSCTTK